MIFTNVSQQEFPAHSLEHGVVITLTTTLAIVLGLCSYGFYNANFLYFPATSPLIPIGAGLGILQVAWNIFTFKTNRRSNRQYRRTMGRVRALKHWPGMILGVVCAVYTGYYIYIAESHTPVLF